MREPLTLIMPTERPDVTAAQVLALFSAGNYEVGITALWDLALAMVQAQVNLPVQLVAECLERVPEQWRADHRCRYLNSWVLYEQRRTAPALLELEDLAAVWADRCDGPEADVARRWMVLVRSAQGLVYEADGRLDRARAAFADASQWMPEAPKQDTGAFASLELDPAEAQRLIGMDPTGMVAIAVKALRCFQATGNRAGLARVAHNLGHLYMELGEPGPARYWLEQALDLKRGQPGEFPLLYTLDSLGRCYLQLGLLNEAQTLLDEALRMAARLGFDAIQASCLACLADVCRDRDEVGTALDLYRRAFALREQMRDPVGMAEIHLALGILHRRTGHAGLAADAAAEALALTHGHCTPTFRAAAAQQEAIARLLLGQEGAATELAGWTAALTDLHAPADVALGHWYLAVHAHRVGQRDEAVNRFRQALTLASRLRHLHLLAMELPVTAGLCATAVGPGDSPELLAGLVQRAGARGLAALLAAVPAAEPLVAAAGRLPAATALQVWLLGSFKLVRAGTEVDLGAARSQKAVSLFKYLVAQRGRAVAREQIIDALWPEADPESADRSFDVTLSTLRRVAELPHGVPLFIRRGRGYLFNPDVPLQLDTERFQTHLSRGNWWADRGQTNLAVAEWEEAEAAYGGDFLADDPYEDWATAERERLREQYLDLLLRLGEWALAAGRPAEAIERAMRVLMADPIREAAYRLLMRAHARQGNRALALRDMQRCSEALQRELGEEPMPETRDLARRIKTGEGC